MLRIVRIHATHTGFDFKLSVLIQSVLNSVAIEVATSEVKHTRANSFFLKLGAKTQLSLERLHSTNIFFGGVGFDTIHD